MTTKPGRLYIHLFTWPKEFTLEGVKGKVTEAYLLGNPQQKKLRFSQEAGRLVLKLKGGAPDELASVVRLDVSEVN